MQANPALSVLTPTDDASLRTDAPRAPRLRRILVALAGLAVLGASIGAVVYSTSQAADATPVALAAAPEAGINLPQVVIALLQQNKPNLSQLVKDNVPASAGKCNEKNAPTPCKEMGYLYQEKGSNYKALARWISGLNVIRFDQVDVTAAANGTMTLRMSATFAALPASLKIDGCLGSLCSNIVDDTKTCCGTDKTVTLVASIGCSETAPFLRNLEFTTATITPIIVQVKVLGQTITKDLTPAIQDKFKSFVSTTGLDYVNAELQKRFETVTCAQ